MRALLNERGFAGSVWNWG